jgi:hypothetical protein
MKLLVLLLMVAGALPGADLSGKWNFIWQTPGGERRSTLTLTQESGKVKAQFPEGKTPVEGAFSDNKLNLAGNLYSSEAGADGAFRLAGTLEGDQLKGTASWNEHEMTFTARRAE